MPLSTTIKNITLGGKSPIRIQSMTDTDTSDIVSTVKQILELEKAGSELIRITIESPESAKAVSSIIEQVRRYTDVPIIGDFHFHGHILLSQYPEMAKALDKWRINPGNIGNGNKQDKNFETIINLAIQYQKPVRIGVNGGSLDQELLNQNMKKNSLLKNSLSSEEVFVDTMVESAVLSMKHAVSLGMKPKDLILSVKHSSVPLMIRAYTQLSQKTNTLLHLGLTEAGGGIQGIVSSSIALGTLLQKGIGDTIRVSITPQKGESRTREVEICKQILQASELRSFQPKIVSCPGCGRTSGNQFFQLVESISKKIKQKQEEWKKYPHYPTLHIAIMGCRVNGVGESKHANIGIFFPGKGEGKQAVVSIDGNQKIIQSHTATGIETQFIDLIEKYLRKRV